MEEYHKINSLWERDPTKKNIIIPGNFAIPEFRYLHRNDWEFTEKVDGTNIRVHCTPRGEDGEPSLIAFGGRMENSQIPAKLVAHLRATFDPLKPALEEKFPLGITFYGEGYAGDIQRSKVGKLYGEEQSFVVFDIKVDGWWLHREDIVEICGELGLPVVPVIAFGTLLDMHRLVEQGFNSYWGEFLAEGLIARPRVPLFSRSGARIIAKLKHKDFINLKRIGG